MDACLEKCACRGSYLDKFLQPAILVVLQRGSSHGFQMISDLEKSGMVSGNGLDPAGLYRTLKRMETSPSCPCLVCTARAVREGGAAYNSRKRR